MKIQKTAVLLFCLFLILEILIGAFASGFLRGYIGDVLVMPAMYCLIRIFTAKFPRSLPGMLFVFACFVEFLQSIDLCGILGIDKHSLLAILIGTHGEWADIFCYLAGTVLIYAWIWMIPAIFKKLKKTKK
ncbi:MAG: DUF2809 domain-containing protein [Oscillospiraceae bacterium]|nr:DUF2809 domain-containing protein [Oscillospiraceae bacterium]